MAKKNFMAYGDAETIFTEYAGALNRKLNCFSGTREEFLALSVEERKKYEYVLDPTSDVVIYAVMDEVDDNTLSFTNNVATVSIPGLTAKSKIWVFYSDESYDVAKAADISVTSGNGVVTFTAANTPTDTITCDILYYLKKDTINFASVVGGGMEMKLLWENSNPSSAFVAQNVAIGDQSGNAFIRVNVRYQSTGSNASLKGVVDIPYGDGNVSNLGVLTGSYSRQATISGNNIQFADAKSGTTTGNGYIIPESIYSIKL